MSASNESHPAVGHVVPLWLLALIGGALLLLTLVTVWATYIDLGAAGNLALAMVIALVKASLVALFFMHLWWDRPINSIVFVSSLAFVTLFIIFALMDSLTYRGDVQQFRQDNPLNMEDPYAPGMVTRPNTAGE